jgi:hypothetical protein
MKELILIIIDLFNFFLIFFGLVLEFFLRLQERNRLNNLIFNYCFLNFFLRNII